jgi:hypothetical protein
LICPVSHKAQTYYLAVMLRLIDDALHVAGEVEWPRSKRQAWHKRVRLAASVAVICELLLQIESVIFSWCETMDESEDERADSDDDDKAPGKKKGKSEAKGVSREGNEASSTRGNHRVAQNSRPYAHSVTIASDSEGEDSEESDWYENEDRLFLWEGKNAPERNKSREEWVQLVRSNNFHRVAFAMHILIEHCHKANLVVNDAIYIC